LSDFLEELMTTHIDTDYLKRLARGGYGDRITQPLYDSILIERGPVHAQMFSLPIGQGKSASDLGAAKTYSDTNMYLPNQLPRDRDFCMTGIGVYFVPDDPVTNRTALDEALYILGRGYLQFRIQNRRYLEIAPLGALPPHFPMYWALDKDALAKLLSPAKAEGEGIALPAAPGCFKITPLLIPAETFFEVSIRIDNYFVLPHAGRLGVILYGEMIRDPI
jgi:hypothetical protein